jgi:hypothetical protein
MSDLPAVDEPHPALIAPEPFNGPLSNPGFAPGGGRIDVVFGTTALEDEAWDPSADEPVSGFDIHLGVYAID